MSESVKTLLMVVILVAVMEVLKRTLGTGVALVVAMSALSFCVGALWGAGRVLSEANPPQPQKGG